MSDEELTISEIEKAAEYLEKQNTGVAPIAEEKHNQHTFLVKVATSQDTTKLGCLHDDEIGKAKFPTRSLQEFALISDKICEDDLMRDFFEDSSEIITATSLSREGFLIKAAITTTRNIADLTKRKQEPRGFFKKKEPQEAPGNI